MLSIALRERPLAAVVFGLGVVLAASCGGDPPKADVPPMATAEATPEPAEAAPEPAPSAAVTAEPTSKPAAASGRPLIQKRDSAEITDTFGVTPGSILELGEGTPAILKLPEGALDKAYTMVFKLDPKAKGNGALVGKVYYLQVQVPGEEGVTTASSTGTAFELALPLGTAKEANLAFGTTTKDDKGKDKVEWKVIPATRVNAEMKYAFFELKELSTGHLHLTSKK